MGHGVRLRIDPNFIAIVGEWGGDIYLYFMAMNETKPCFGILLHYHELQKRAPSPLWA